MNICKPAAALLLIIAGATAQAASLTLVPSAATVAPGGAFTVNLVLDATSAPGFHPGIFSGQILLDFDNSELTYGGFVASSDVTFYLAPTGATTGNTQTVSFGFVKPGDVGTVGTFSFTALGAPGTLAELGLVDGDDFFGSSFVNNIPTEQRFTPLITGAQVSIVPLPAGLWLLGTAVGALALRRRFRTTAT
ncbi:MAG: VPLPA-CTERM sorting domain-containing protein [Gammaproteobacteria bacterium]|nr:VPLPA-CTERM sorting domain-containing protein [Gammaproteobacteria bacterium]